MMRVEVGFDGSCPHSPEGVLQFGDAAYRILPSWRGEPGLSEECLGRTTRLGFRAVNDGTSPMRARFLIDWQYDDAPPDAPKTFPSLESYMQHRDFCVVRWPGKQSWEYVAARTEDSVASLDLVLPPGTTEIQWHPPYTYQQGEEFVDNLGRHPLVRIERAGHSREGRNIWLLRISDDGPGQKRRFFIRARSHAYESGGSYMMEGAVRFLLGGSALASSARRDYEFYVLPMANPDGVHNGMGRLTAPRGSNLDFSADETGDPALVAGVSAVDRVKPEWFFDLHNWQSKWWDGVLGLRPEQEQRFLYYMGSPGPIGKIWWRRGPEAWPETLPLSLTRYSAQQSGGKWAALELGWFGRQPEDGRRFGEKALWALLMTEYEVQPDPKYRVQLQDMSAASQTPL